MFFIYAASFYGILEASHYINEFVKMVLPSFKYKNEIVVILEITVLLFLYFILITAFRKIFPR